MDQRAMRRELGFVRWAGWTERRGGAIGAAQAEAERRGWLRPHPNYPQALILTAAGLAAFEQLAALVG